MLPTDPFSTGKSRSSTVATLTDLIWVSESSTLSAAGAVSERPLAGASAVSTALATPPSSLGALPELTAKYTPAAKLSTATAAAAPVVMLRLAILMNGYAAVRGRFSALQQDHGRYLRFHLLRGITALGVIDHTAPPGAPNERAPSLRLDQ